MEFISIAGTYVSGRLVVVLSICFDGFQEATSPGPSVFHFSVLSFYFGPEFMFGQDECRC